MPKPSPDHPVLRAAARWRDRCLLNEGSVFTEKSLWTSENVGYLVRYYVENLDYGEGTFFEKLENQLAPAPGSAKQLAAEMFWVMYLFTTGMQPGTKRRQIRQVWEWSNEPLPDAVFEFGEALQEGVGNPGTAFNTHRWREFLFFVLAMEAWTALSRPQREARLADPWSLAKWLKEQDETRTRQLRHILLYLLFPRSLRSVRHRDPEEHHRARVREEVRGGSNRVRLQGPNRHRSADPCHPRKAPGGGCRGGFRFPRRTVFEDLAS